MPGGGEGEIHAFLIGWWSRSTARRARLDNPRGSAAAAAAFDDEAGFQRRTGRFAAMARALLRSGRAWLDAGDPGPAADRLYRAARSLFGQGAAAAAREAAETARAAAVGFTRPRRPSAR